MRLYRRANPYPGNHRGFAINLVVVFDYDNDNEDCGNGILSSRC